VNLWTQAKNSEWVEGSDVFKSLKECTIKIIVIKFEINKQNKLLLTLAVLNKVAPLIS